MTAIKERPFNNNSFNDLLNKSFDGDYNVLVVEPMGFDGVSLQRPIAQNMAMKITELSGHLYIATAAPGTTEDTAKWQVKDFYNDGSGTMSMKWADGDSNFDNLAVDLIGLNFI